MHRRIFRVFTFALMLVMVMMSMNLTASADVSSNSFEFLNMSGCSISEIYIYPSYNSSLGQPRNREWVTNGSSAIVRFTNAELRLNGEWSLRICYIKNGYHYYSQWDNLRISDFVGVGTVIVTANEYGGMTLDYSGSAANTQAGSFTLCNMTGSSITEIYFYPINNSNWGNLRNRNWLLNGNELTIRFSANEMMLDADWCMRLGFASGKYSFVYWENIDLRDFVDSGYVTVYTTSDGYYLDFE